MVLRAQNLVGYHAYPDDIVEAFVYQAAEAGIDIFLTFDALQDLRNCETAFKAIKRAGKKIEGSVQYNISPFHTTEAFVKNALEQEEMGVSLMHVEDMAGLLTPSASYELISALKKALKIPVHLHCHCTGGMAVAAYWEAIRAGVDGLDVCVSALSMGPSVPAIETFLAALKGTSRDPKIDIGQFRSINDDLKAVRAKYAEFETKLVGVDVGCLQHQIPGGMLSNLESQLKGMNMLQRLPEVLDEVARVRADMGFPPLATPSSQICGVQATMNVMTGQRYKMVPKGIKEYCRGMYGMPPGELLAPGIEPAKQGCAVLARVWEDVLTYALFLDEKKLERSREILGEPKESRGGRLLDAHKVMLNETTTKVHAKLALENGATLDEIFEVIRIIFFTCGVTKLLPALETLGNMFEPEPKE